MRWYVFFICCCVGNIAFAADSFYCAQSMETVRLGATLAYVEQVCGKASRSQSVMVPQMQAVRALVYKKLQRKTDGSSTLSILSVHIADGKVVRLSENGESVESSNLCLPSRAIAVGDSFAEVMRTCGNPVVAKPIVTQTREVPQIVLTYSDNAYSQGTSLYFENFKLVKITP